MTEHERMRIELWSRVYAAAVSQSSANGALWADLALKDYDERFGYRATRFDPSFGIQTTPGNP